MGLIPNLLILAGHTFALLIDIIILFVVIRLICCWRPVRALRELDTAGRPLVSMATRNIVGCWRRLRPSTRLTRNRELPLSLAALCVLRLLLVALLGP